MNNTLNDIEERITEHLNPSFLNIEDESIDHQHHPGAKMGAGHYILTVVSHQFLQKTLIERHRMVYNALEGLMDNIHAIQISAKTPEEYSAIPAS